MAGSRGAWPSSFHHLVVGGGAVLCLAIIAATDALLTGVTGDAALRERMHFVFVATAILTCLVFGIPGKVRPWVWNGSAYIRGTDFYLHDYPLSYRLQFSVVGTRLSFRVLNLTAGQLIQEMPPR